MTCIVGLVHDGIVTIGGDSAGVGDGYDHTTRADPKVFRFDHSGIVIGYSTSFRMGQLIRFGMDHDLYGLSKLDGPEADHDPFQWACTAFVDALRGVLETGGYAEKKDGVERGGELLVGIAGRLFCVYEDFQIAESALPYQAIGCGANFALGAMHRNPEPMTPVNRIELSLQAAATFSAGVSPPFVLVSTE